jgi:Uma2 family endonuclease
MTVGSGGGSVTPGIFILTRLGPRSARWQDGRILEQTVGVARACYRRRVGQPNRLRPPATYDDLLKVSGHLVAEILDGELYASPRPAPRHASASSGLGGALHGPFDRGRAGPGGWWILDEPEVHLGRDVVVPDLGGWRRERLPRLPEDAFFALAPDWVCEVLSPSTAAMDRVKKLAIYAREAVSHVWFVDPIAQTLEVLRLDAGRWTIVSTWAGVDVVRAEPFEALELDLSWLWGEPPPDARR